MEIERGMTAEYAIAKVVLPRSKKPLSIQSNGSYNAGAWTTALQEGGPSARVGDQVQITRVQIEENKIVFQINGGTKGGGHWYDHVQVGMNGGMAPVSTNQNTAANGTYLELVFKGGVPSLKSGDIRQILSNVLDFEKHSAAQQYVESLPEPVKQAIKQQKAINGMTRDQVLLALGKPRNKSRETSPDGDDIEDWVYGEPPGKMTFVRFSEGKVVKVEESYANVGGTTAPPLPPPR